MDKISVDLSSVKNFSANLQNKNNVLVELQPQDTLQTSINENKISAEIPQKEQVSIDFHDRLNFSVEPRLHKDLIGLSYEESGHTGFASSNELEQVKNDLEKVKEENKEQTLQVATTDRLGGIKVGENLGITNDGILSVQTTNNAEEDNTKPITSAGAYTILGNIEVILNTI